MGALPANLSIGSMFRVLVLLCLAVLSMGEPEPEAKAVADPKADPYLLYGGYYGLGHYGGYYGYPYYGYYGKRSADAEPVSAADAKAEANPWYGYYGHGLGYYGLGYYGHYGYPYLYGKRSADAEAGPAPKAEASPEADPYLLWLLWTWTSLWGLLWLRLPILRRLLLWQVRRVEIQLRADKDEVPRFLTTTCFVFSTSEKSKCSKQNFFKLAAFKHLYILYCGIFACIPAITFKTSRKNEKCVILVSDFIQRLRIKCRCLTKKSFNIKENIMLTIFQYPCPSLDKKDLSK